MNWSGIMYIKYLDQIRTTGGFQTIEQIKKVSPRTIEAIGFKIKEDDTGITLASIINGEAYNNILFIPKGAIIETNDVDRDIIEFIEAQGITKQLTLKKLESLPKPPLVKITGFIAYTDENTIHIAQEKNEPGEYRTIVAIPKSLIVTEVKLL